MREIKFRVWNKQLKQMLSHDWLIDAKVLYSAFFNNSNADLMQWTGLTDRNGKEIYEGDIIAWDYEYDSDYDGDMPIVKRSAGRGRVKDIFDTWQIKEAAREGKGVEVIGNIYETPELLKQ